LRLMFRRFGRRLSRLCWICSALPRPRVFEARLPTIFMPPSYLAALRAYVFQDGVSLAKFMSRMTHDLILVRSAGFREGSTALQAFINAVKLWVLCYHECVGVGWSRHPNLNSH
jgi:hypothetical protein